MVPVDHGHLSGLFAGNVIGHCSMMLDYVCHKDKSVKTFHVKLPCFYALCR